jgi:bacterioferritin
VRGHLAKGVALCEQHGDYVSRDLLVAQMKDTEEDHTLWLEQQLRLIRRLGAELYLQTQIGDAE